MKVKYALPGDEQRKEMTAISNCWDILSKLDVQARARSLEWLRMWARSEVPKDEDVDL